MRQRMRQRAVYTVRVTTVTKFPEPEPLVQVPVTDDPRPLIERLYGRQPDGSPHEYTPAHAWNPMKTLRMTGKEHGA